MHTTNNPQRVAYVLKRYPRYSETFVVNEILAHEAVGLDVSIFALRPPSDTHFQHAIANVRAPVTYLRSGGIRAETLWSECERLAELCPEIWDTLSSAGACDGNEVYQAVRLARELVAQDIQHVHAHFATTATTVARLASRIAGIPYTFTAHAKDIFHEHVDAESLGRKIHDAAAVLTVSDYNVRHLRRLYPRSAARIHRVYNGLDLAEFPFVSPDDRPREILAVGRLVEKKGFADLIDACAVLRRSRVAYHCRIIGGGDLTEALHNKVLELGLSQQVELVGPRPLSEVRVAVQNAALLAAPCVTASTGDQDGMPTVLLEAMALGTPCVTTDVAGIPEAIRDRDTGLMVAPQQPVQLANAMERLLDCPRLRVDLANAARGLMEREFNITCNSRSVRHHFAPCAERELASGQLAEVG